MSEEKKALQDVSAILKDAGWGEKEPRREVLVVNSRGPVKTYPRRGMPLVEVMVVIAVIAAVSGIVAAFFFRTFTGQ